ncbi:hypothetical protein QQS21_011116 [Conoideocrella luteorostrata]|uniref:Uncharacterized protein n=1 Tax=Conoideocrella luteorostrata TaxID=1105319 RepID=A0AAJ0FU18_9HYPO|nr:hypothetical protein QQS21_011116 [Conoideocrella luteorostrata]
MLRRHWILYANESVHLKATKITPPEYLEHSPISIQQPHLHSCPLLTRHCRVFHESGALKCLLRKGAPTVIVRLSNPRALRLDNTSRVENEVAAVCLVRGAPTRLGPDYNGFLPDVYVCNEGAGTEPASGPEEGSDWTVMRFMEGEQLDGQFETFDGSQEETVIEEIAKMVLALQGVSSC